MDQKISGDEFVRGRVFNDSMSLYNDLCQRELDVYSHKKKSTLLGVYCIGPPFATVMKSCLASGCFILIS